MKPKEVTIQNSKIILRDFGNPETIWFFQRGFGYRGFVGETIDGRDCLAINLGDSILAYAAQKNQVTGTVFWINYIVLHELTHLATKSDKAHRYWMVFICRLLDSLTR